MPMSILAVICAVELAVASTVVLRLQPAPLAFGIPTPRPTLTDVLRFVSVTLTMPGPDDTLKACDVPPFTVSTLEKVSVVGPVVVVVEVDGAVGLLEHPAPKDATTSTAKSAGFILTI